MDDCAANPFITLAVTTAGGHLAFFEGNSIFEYPTTWSAGVILEYCNAIKTVFQNMDGVHPATLNLSSDKAVMPKQIDDSFIQNISSIENDGKTVRILGLGVAFMAGYMA